MPWFLNIKDKTDTVEILDDGIERFCPPHRLPHTLPIFGKLITDEPCHIHHKAWRHYGHHQHFCWLLSCPNYEAMKQAKCQFVALQE